MYIVAFGPNSGTITQFLAIRDPSGKSGSVPDVPGRLATMLTAHDVKVNKHGYILYLSLRFNAEDCTDEEGLPNFSSLTDYSLHPELQVK